jgi:hypothetical protein
MYRDQGVRHHKLRVHEMVAQREPVHPRELSNFWCRPDDVVRPNAGCLHLRRRPHIQGPDDRRTGGGTTEWGTGSLGPRETEADTDGEAACRQVLAAPGGA